MYTCTHTCIEARTCHAMAVYIDDVCRVRPVGRRGRCRCDPSKVARGQQQHHHLCVGHVHAWARGGGRGGGRAGGRARGVCTRKNGWPWKTSENISWYLCVLCCVALRWVALRHKLDTQSPRSASQDVTFLYMSAHMATHMSMHVYTHV